MPATPEASDDTTLLQAVTQQRDRAAFAELFKRYHQRAFSVAYRVLRNDTLAEDAVQEAMLSLWLSTKTAPPQNVQAWLLGIVMKKSLHIGRSQKRASTRKDRMAKEFKHADENPAAGSDGAESIATLRSHIEGLPELDRTLLLCSFGASMSHRSIAETVGVPQRTVTDRIQNVLARLRKDLTRAGIASAIPMLAADSLFEALTAGHECPPGMAERLLYRIPRAMSSETGRASRPVRRRPIRSAGSNAITGAAIAGLAAISAIAYLMGGNPPQAPAEPKPVAAPMVAAPASVPVPAAAAPLAAPVAEKKDAPLYKRWTFEKGPASDLKAYMGDWTWEADNTGGHMVAPLDGLVFVSLPVTIPARPVVINIKVIQDVRGNGSFGALWSKGGQVLMPWVSWNEKFNFDAKLKRFILKLYVIDRYVVSNMDDRTVNVHGYADAYPASELSLNFKKLNVEEIEIKELEASDIPAQLRDIPKLIEGLGVPPLVVNGK